MSLGSIHSASMEFKLLNSVAKSICLARLVPSLCNAGKASRSLNAVLLIDEEQNNNATD